MTHHPNHPAGQRFTARWGLDWDDYRRAIALQAHYTNKLHIGIDALLIDAAEHGRVHQLIVAMLDLNETIIMGILNATPDSFSDGGEHAGSIESAARRATSTQGCACAIMTAPALIFQMAAQVFPSFTPSRAPCPITLT